MAIQINIQDEYYSGDHLYDQRDFNIDLESKYEYIFRFYETDDFYVTFNGPNDLEVEIESFREDGVIKVKNGEKIQLSNGKSGDCYFAGYFRVVFTTNHHSYYTQFLCDTKNLAYKNVTYLRDYVNSYYQGLSQYDNKKTNIVHQNQSKENSFYDSVRFFMNDFNKTLSLINSYNNAPYNDIEKEGRISNKIDRIDSKSMKWLVTKGLAHNQNLNKIETMMNNKVVISYNNTENRAFAYLVNYWSNEANSLLIQVNIYLNNSKQQLIQLESRYQEENQNYILIEDDYTIPYSLKKARLDKLQRTAEDIREIKSRIEEYESHRNQLQKIVTMLRRYHNSSYLRNLMFTPSDIEGHIRDPKLRMIINHRNEYIRYKAIRSNHKKDIGFREKSTPDLYETYVYILLINILKVLGYIPIQDETNNDLMYLLSHTSTFTLKKDHQYCDIIYDKELRKSTDSFEQSEYCYLNSFHNRPDFILSFYEEDSKPYETLIIETKWRAKHQIYNENDDTEVVLALKDYLNIVYYDHNTNKRCRGIVSKVFALYPDENEEITIVEEDDIQAVGILPNEDMLSSKGYNYLCSTIEGCSRNEVP